MRIRTGLAALALALLSSCGTVGTVMDGMVTRAEPLGLCEVPGLVAAPRAPVEGPGACGVEDPIVVTQVAGVNLSRPAIMTCDTARALDRWTRAGALPTVGNRGGGLAEMTVAAHYACRTRNSRPGARISEHATGNAIDLSSFVFADGSRVTVLDGWRGAERDRKLLRRLHGTACGLFGTVLGPASDRYHQNHFHFDVAGYRRGPYCR